MGRTPGEGKLRIGDHWNAIRIIAFSQSNPLKAIAEFVENSIDARATRITIFRGKQRGEHYVKIVDDGEGIPDFTYVATHIGDSIKRKLKKDGDHGIQGEFGIGLLSFWTVGEELTLTSRASDGVVRRMRLVKDSPAYSIRESQELFDQPGTTLIVRPILPGVRALSGEKIQSYLASELRDRITRSGVEITIVDRSARRELVVVPRKFHGVLAHDLPAPRSALGEIYVELYLCSPSVGAGVGLYKSGTRVIEDLRTIDALDHAPWSSGYLEGIVDADFLTLTPGTRSGIVYDEKADELLRALRALEPALSDRIAEQQRAEEEEASRSTLRSITRALREAFSMLPEEQYGWLATMVSRGKRTAPGRAPGAEGESADGASHDDGEGGGGTAAAGEQVADRVGSTGEPEPAFYEMPGPLFRVDIRPGKATVAVGGEQRFSAVGRDKSRRVIDGTALEYAWSLEQGSGTIEAGGEFATYRAPAEPELAAIRVRALQRTADGTERSAEAEALVTVTAELIARQPGERGPARGLPGYTFSYLPGSLWRSRYEESDALITVNSGHPDFVHACRQPKTKLRYIARLYAKEIVFANFPGASREELLERLVELTLYMDEYLR